MAPYTESHYRSIQGWILHCICLAGHEGQLQAKALGCSSPKALDCSR